MCKECGYRTLHQKKFKTDELVNALILNYLHTYYLDMDLVTNVALAYFC